MLRVSHSKDGNRLSADLLVNRFTRPPSAPPQRPLTAAQERSLVALVELCSGLGEEASAAEVAAKSGVRHGATTLALRGLERRRLVTGHGADHDPRMWTPTLTGRALARHLRGGDDEPRVERPDADGGHPVERCDGGADEPAP
jgi:hypothetical protein